jgi:hypothetical protein
MFKTHSALPRSVKAAVGLGAAVASLAFAGVASAAVTVVQPDQPTSAAQSGSCPGSATSSNLTNAIDNSAAGDTLVLVPGLYCPVDPSGQSTITIAHNLNIVVDHSYQSTLGLPNIEVQGIDALGANEFTVNSGVNLVLEGFNINLGGGPGGNTFVNNGSITTWGMTFDSNYTPAIDNATSSSTAVLNDSTVSDGIADGMTNSGTMTLTDVSLVNNSGHALDILPGSKTYAYNTLIADNGTNGCFLGKFTNNPAPGSLDDDGTCGVQYSDNGDIDSYIGTSASVNGTGEDNTNGGPASTTTASPNNDSTLKGNSSYCFTTDERFFVNPVVGGVIKCDIGAVTGSNDGTTGGEYASGNPVPNSATQETTAPSCTVTGGTSGVSQQVTLKDLFSGIGLEIGLDTDNPSNTVATAYPPPLAVPVAGHNVSNLQISNGSVSFTSPTSPTLSGVVLTAGNKTTPGVNNSNWSFTGLNWAGVAKNCF